MQNMRKGRRKMLRVGKVGTAYIQKMAFQDKIAHIPM